MDDVALDTRPGALVGTRTDALINARLRRLANVAFRARFRLRPSERAYVADRGLATICQHAEQFVAARLAPASPARDGHQTPWGGHPVFVAQHATATCCRGCLQQNHGITAHRPLTDREQRYVVAVIQRWIEQELGRPPAPDRRARAPRHLPAQEALLP